MVCIIVNLFTFSRESIFLFIGDSLFLLIKAECLWIELSTQEYCGIAGFSPEEIAPLFAEAAAVENISLPEDFLECYFRFSVKIWSTTSDFHSFFYRKITYYPMVLQTNGQRIH